MIWFEFENKTPRGKNMKLNCPISILSNTFKIAVKQSYDVTFEYNSLPYCNLAVYIFLSIII